MNQPPGYGPPPSGYGPPGYPPQQGYPQQPPPKKGMSTFASVLLALIVFFVVIPLGSCVACAVCAGVKKGMDDSKARAGDGGASVSTATATAVPEPTAPPAPTTVAVSLATFTKDTLLDECIDFTITPPQGTEVDAAFLDDFAEGITKGRVRNTPASTARSIAATAFVERANKGKPLDGTRIYKTCTDQFREKPVLAKCAVRFTTSVTGDHDADLGTYEVAIMRGFHNLDTLTNDDANMRQCIAAKGNWTGVDKDSTEYREAVRARARRNIEKLQRTLGQ